MSSFTLNTLEKSNQNAFVCLYQDDFDSKSKFYKVNNIK